MILVLRLPLPMPTRTCLRRVEQQQQHRIGRRRRANELADLFGARGALQHQPANRRVAVAQHVEQLGNVLEHVLCGGGGAGEGGEGEFSIRMKKQENK